MTAIVDYDAGNIKSVGNALSRLGMEHVLSSDPAVIASADRVILPGVGNAAEAMESLRSKGLEPIIKGLRRPVLGICVGMQVMCRDSEEGDARCMGIFDAHVRKFDASAGCKVPHMGWNDLHNLDGKLFKGISGGEFCYFIHSYYPTLCTDTVATCSHAGVMFSAALRYENFYGTQFHPEKSGDVGERILKNFLAI